MRDPTNFAGYRSPAEVLEDTALTVQDKNTALRTWRSAVQRVKRLYGEEVLRHESFVAEIDAVLARLSGDGEDRLAKAAYETCRQRRR